MNPEDEYNRQVYYVLRKIKRGSLRRLEGKPIEYIIHMKPEYLIKDEPNAIEESEIINQLIEKGVVTKIEPELRVDSQISERVLNPIIYFRLEIVPAKFVEYWDRYKKYAEQRVGNERLLIFCTNGSVEYISATGEKYQSRFNPRTNPYRLLLYLAQNPHQIFDFDDLANKLREQREGASSTEERRVRDTIEAIRKSMKLPAMEMFRVDYGFELDCNVELKA